jgi:hypothetical protein
MSRAYSAPGKRMHVRYWWESQEARDHWEDLDVGRKDLGGDRIGWYRLDWSFSGWGPVEGSCERAFGFHRMLGNSWETEWLAASEAGLSSIELFRPPFYEEPASSIFSMPWRWRQQVQPGSSYPSCSLHISFQKTAILTFSGFFYNAFGIPEYVPLIGWIMNSAWFREK